MMRLSAPEILETQHSRWLLCPSSRTTSCRTQNYFSTIKPLTNSNFIDASHQIRHRLSQRTTISGLPIPNALRKLSLRVFVLNNSGNCSASYSIATVSAINDRYCLQNKEDHPRLSAQAPIACDKAINNQCKGGYVSRTLDYAKIYGLVDESCLPYDITKTDKTVDCTSKIKECQKWKIADYCVSSTEEGIKQEIFNHGPVIVVIPVYRDFLIYKEGLYQVYPKNQRFPSGHAVKIIGWDVKEGKNCWIIENSWGKDWGINGTACLLVGQEELDLERFALAPALPQLNKEGE
jgi:hypothetical protein